MSIQSIPADSDAAILDRILSAGDDQITQEAAGYLISRKFSEQDEARVDDLSAKARAGSLSESERKELDRYLHVASLVAVMQSHGRRTIQRSAPTQI